MKDEDVWQAYAQRVKRVFKARKAVPAAPRRKAMVEAAPRGLAPEWRPAMAVVDPQRQAPLQQLFDRRTERKLRDGLVAIDAKLDLHGMTQDQAHEALGRFLAAQIRRGSRQLLIVTGKGRGNNGVLKAQLAGWLEAMEGARQIIDLRPAAARHGGEGAFYVWLKKGDR